MNPTYGSKLNPNDTNTNVNTVNVDVVPSFIVFTASNRPELSFNPRPNRHLYTPKPNATTALTPATTAPNNGACTATGATN